VKVKQGRWVDAAGALSVSIDVSDNSTLTCAGGTNGANVTYTGTPTVLLGKLQGCFNNVVTLNGWASYFAFFEPAAALMFRAMPPAIDAQWSSTVIGMRIDMYLRDVSQAWVDYRTPAKLSVGPGYRFTVNLRRVHETATGNVVAATYAIQNLGGTIAGGGYVRPQKTRPMHSAGDNP
ncbi:MAG: hypothetical protein ACREMA_17230, partial [Longimicrobiales bacterium]